MGLLLGDRADIKAIADKSRKTIVEAVFDMPRSKESEDASDNELSELIVRREILPAGRSRAFVDDSPVTLPQLSSVMHNLLDIHSQHANLKLTSREGQLQIIDAMADNEELLEDYRELFKNYVSLRNRLRRIKEEKTINDKRKETLNVQLSQLKKLNVRKGEQEEVERNFELLSDADTVRDSLQSVYYYLLESDTSALSGISRSILRLQEISGLISEDNDSGDNLLSRLNELAIELKDIAETSERKADSIDSSPTALAKVSARMKELYDAVKAFHVSNADELVDLRSRLEREVAKISENDEDIAILERDGRHLAVKLKNLASEISERRLKAAADFSHRLTRRARPLGLTNLRFEVRIEKTKLSITGQDSVEFLCAFNKNGEMLPMASTASGGELSRLTLSIKSLMAEKIDMPTVIFDEIDTGVGGEIAAKMGKMMVDMADKTQILAITHLPQVAAKGKRHYKVMKKDTPERTVSTIRELDFEGRIREIAGMLSGERITEAALKAAMELVEKNN